MTDIRGKPRKMGRPQKEINQQQFESMCSIQATQEEICLVLGLSDKTLNRWCRQTYGTTFSEVFAQKRALGKISLRRYQWQLAKKNANMAIFLGKQFLGQKDEQSLEVSGNLNPYANLSEAQLKKLADVDG